MWVAHFRFLALKCAERGASGPARHTKLAVPGARLRLPAGRCLLNYGFRVYVKVCSERVQAI